MFPPHFYIIMIKKIFVIAVVGLALSACGAKSGSENVEDIHEHSESCDSHNHGHDHSGHAHSNIVKVSGIAQAGDATSGKITIKKLHGGEAVTYDYTKSNQDQIAAWLEGDTVTVYIDSHKHGSHRHETVTKIRIGDFECGPHSHSADAHTHTH